MDPTSSRSAEIDERPTKRQRTNSPPDSSSRRSGNEGNEGKMAHPLEEEKVSENTSSSIPGLGMIHNTPTKVEAPLPVAAEGDSLLDSLIRHVDAQSHIDDVPVQEKSQEIPTEGFTSQGVTEQPQLIVEERDLSHAAKSETVGHVEDIGPTNRWIDGTPAEEIRPDVPSKQVDTPEESAEHISTNRSAPDQHSHGDLQEMVLAAGDKSSPLPATTASGPPAIDDVQHANSMELQVESSVLAAGSPSVALRPEVASSFTEGLQPDVTSLRDQLPLVEETAASNDAPKDAGAEWEIDSEPVDSSSDSTSSSDTSSSEDSDDGVENDEDYTMLDPEEQARILMQGEGGSDDEGNARTGQQHRTQNEKPEEMVQIPSIQVTEDMKIEELGSVEGVVENTVLIKAKTSGEYQVLESNSLLCLQDRSVIGVVSETLGRVQQPLYTVRFTNEDAIKAAGLWQTNAKIFYVKDHSTFVFTQPLRGFKGSDASNIHDEEVGAGEMEFSDDEAEAEHKRSLKLKKKFGRDTPDTRQGSHRGQRGGGRGGNSRNGSMYANNNPEMNYDDVPVKDEDGYTPLARPTNLHEMMGTGEAPVEGRPMPPPFSDGGFERGRGRGQGRGQFRGQGRGDQGRGRGRGGRGRGGWERRGDSQTNPSMNHHQAQPTAPSPTVQQPQHQTSPFALPPMPPISQNPYPQQYPQQHPQPQQPHYPHISSLTTSSIPQAPTIPPQPNGTNYVPFSPSPISPLPGTNFNFNSFAAQYNQNQHQPYQQQQQSHQNQQSPNTGYPPNFNGQGQGNFAGWNGAANAMGNGNGNGNGQMGPLSGSHINPNFFGGMGRGMGPPGNNTNERTRGGWHG